MEFIIASLFAILLASVTSIYIANVNKRREKCRRDEFRFAKDGYDYKTQSGIPLFKDVTYEVKGAEYEYIGEVDSLDKVPNKKCLFIINGILYIRKEPINKTTDIIDACDIE